MDRRLLIGGSVVVLLLTTALAALILIVPLINPDVEGTRAEIGVLFGIASVGIASAGATLQSARHEGKWGWVGLVLGLVYLGLPWVLIYYAVGIIHLVIIPAMFAVGLAVVNTPSLRSKE